MMRIAIHLAGAMLLMAVSGVCADQKAKPEPPPKGAAKAAGPKNAKNEAKAGGTPKKGGPALNNPLNPAQRLMQMTPEQRERVLEQLPPERQAQLRRTLEKLDSLPPAEKERIARQVQSANALPPATQRIISQGIHGMNSLPADRKPLVRKELLSLFNMEPEDRAARLNSADFKKAYSPDEQKILSDLSNNLPPDYPIAGRK
jgi:Protein of unknown function (DUF3106)